jgi:methionyl-tRNA formyltransferase
LKVEKLNLASWASKHHVKVINTDDFNSREIQSYIGRHSIELGVFTGGGLIRKNILQAFKRGIINCHGGLLPAYRGLDVEKWAILENNAGALGCCAHMMTEAVDEGAVVAQYLFKLKKPTTVEKIGLGYEYPQAILLTHAVLELLGDRVKPISQHKHDGRQFFYMHDSLVNIIQSRLSKQ